jgi:ribosomal protein bL25 (Ctc-form)
VPEVRIAAEPRTEFGKGPARRERRAGRVPAVLYGHGADTRHVSLPGHDVLMALRTANVLIRLEGLPGGVQLALPKAVQRDPIKGWVEHVDLLVVRRGEKVTVDVPSKDTGAGVVCWTAGVSRVQPGSAEWFAIIGALLAGRLNEPAGAPAEYWAAHGNVYRLTPGGI